MILSRKTIFGIIIGLVGVLAVFGAGFFAGMVYDVNRGLLNGEGSVEITKVIDLYSKTRSPNINFSQYWEIWDRIKNKHIKQPVSEVDLFYSSLEGLVQGLKDPYSVYFPPSKAEEFARELAGEFDGIGAEIGMQDNQPTVIAPLPNSPAARAGIKAGDKVLAVDGADTFGKSLDEVINSIRGPEGTQVKLTVGRGGLETIQDYTITRETINIPTIEWRMEANNFAYLRIGYFNENTWAEFDRAVSEILMKSPDGLILDLRNNPGGYLDVSVRIASEWIPEGIVVVEQFNDGRQNSYKSEGTHRFKDMPTVVLVDNGTASGSEILAGALQDYERARLIGIKTFGKGSVQDFEVLPDGSALKLTVAEWITPDGRHINDAGIEPDEKIEEMFVQKQGTEGKAPGDFIDKGLEKAIEMLK